MIAAIDKYFAHFEKFFAPSKSPSRLLEPTLITEKSFYYCGGDTKIVLRMHVLFNVKKLIDNIFEHIQLIKKKLSFEKPQTLNLN